MRTTQVLSRFTVVLAILLLNAIDAEGQSWATGKDFRKALDRTIGVTWADTPLRDALHSLSTSQDVAIFLDRRVDPTMPINAAADLGPLQETLRTVLRKYELGIGFVGPVIYVGPKQTAARIGTLAELRNEKASRFDLGLRKPFARRTPLSWEELSEPSAIAAGLAERANLEFGNLDVIPHDRWLAIDLPPLTLSESLTLVLAGFSMNFTLDEEAGETKLMVTRFPIGVVLERSYASGDEAEDRMKEISNMLPQAFVEHRGNNVVVRSLLEDHWKLEKLYSPTKNLTRSSRGKKTQAYTLKVENKPAGKVIEILADQIGLGVEFASGTEQLIQQLISFSVKNVDAGELLNAAAAEASMSAEIKGTTVFVTP